MQLRNLDIEKTDIRSIQTVEMKFMKRTARYSLLDHRRNEDILKEIKIYPVEKN
jgi:hypothetical protein